MTDFDTYESSVDSSRPVELYQFIRGASTWLYTSGSSEVDISGDVYTPISISRNNISQGADQDKRTLVVSMPTVTSLAQDYITVPPGVKTTLNVFRLQRDEVPAFDTQILLFKGTVKSVRYPGNGTRAEFAVRSIESALDGTIPRWTFMGMCNHILYGAGCGVSDASFNHIGNVSSASGSVITLDGASASGLDFVGGYVRPTSIDDFRLVLAQSGDDLTLLLPLNVDPTGMNVQAFAGCDHVLTGDCALVYDNVARFGGFHFVPSRNIFRNGVSVAS